MNIVWTLIAVLGMNEVILEGFERPGDCHAQLEKIEKVEGITYECVGQDLGSYNSQPSWMTDEQAQALIDKYK